MRLSKRGGTVSWATPSPKPFVEPHPMSKDEFHDVCEKLGIRDNIKASLLFSVSPRSAQRYWYGELKVPGPVAQLLRLYLSIGHHDPNYRPRRKR